MAQKTISLIYNNMGLAVELKVQLTANIAITVKLEKEVTLLKNQIK